jgi:integrase
VKQELDNAIQDYLRFRRSQDISKNTLACQRSILKKFLSTSGNIYCHSITEYTVTRYFETVSRTKQPQSQRNDYTTLAGFFDWCRHTKRMSMDSNPLYGRRRPKDVRRERNRLSVGKFPHLLEAAEQRCARDRALVATLLYTLLRDQELADLRIGDLDLDGGWLRCRIHKTREEDMMPISAELDTELRKWLTTYTAEVGRLENHYHLLPSRWVRAGQSEAGGRFTHIAEDGLKPESPIGSVGRIVNPILANIGFPVLDANGKPCGEGAHTIRRSGARALFDDLIKTEPDAIYIVKEMLHHKSVQQTEHYIGRQRDRGRRDDVLRGRVLYHADAENVVALAR